MNRNSKIIHYKNTFPEIDPLPRVDQIISEIPNLTDVQFHYKFVDIFNSLRDFHTSYKIPGVHACITLYKPLSFTIVGEGEEQKIVAANIVKNQQILDFSPQVHQVTRGDQLISIDGIPIMKYLDDLKFVSRGANEYGALRSALSHLEVINLRTNKLPRFNQSIYKFQSNLGRKYSVILPWVAAADVKCVNQANELLKSYNNVTNQVPLVPSTMTKTKLPLMVKRSEIWANSFSDIIKYTFGWIADLDEVRVYSTNNAHIFWAIYKPFSKNLGIIFLDSFIPVGIDWQTPLKVIRGLLNNELRYTNAVLIDVRINTGGLHTIADTIPQLFGMNINTTSARVLVNDINRDILLNPKYKRTDEWTDAYLATSPHDTYTPYVRLTDPYDANFMGQAYVKPVGVFTTGKCYSACDLFVANMKDNNLAIIFGEDGRTGGGGADAVDYALLSIQRPDYFPAIPFKQSMPLAAQDITVGYRESVRINGLPIEDLGIESDYIIRPSVDDLDPHLISSTQFDRIADILIEEGKKSGKDKLVFQIKPHEQVQIPIDESAEFQLEVAGYHAIAVYNVTGSQIYHTTMEPNKLSELRIQLASQSTLPELCRFEIRGLDSQGKPIFSTWRVVKYTPTKSNYLQITNPTNLSLTFQPYTGIYESWIQRGKGWTSKNNNFIAIREGTSNLDSTLSLFINTNSNLDPSTGVLKRQAIEFEISHSLATEYDSIQAGYIQSSTHTTQLLTEHLFEKVVVRMSGSNRFKRRYLLPFGDVEFFFRVSCDDGGLVIIHSISLE